MDDLEKYRAFIKELILDRSKNKYANSTLEKKPVFDTERDRYLLMVTGFEGIKRHDYALIDVEIRNGKFWIHYDGLEDGVAAYFLEKKACRKKILSSLFTRPKNVN